MWRRLHFRHLGRRAPRSSGVGAYTYYTLDTWLTGQRVGAYASYTFGHAWPTGQRVGLCTLYTLDTARLVWRRLALRWPTSAFGLRDQSAATPVACAGPQRGVAEYPELVPNLSHLVVPTSPPPCVSARAA